MQKKSLRFYDIAANLSDHQFKGVYFNKERHSPDYEKVFSRSEKAGVSHLLIASGNSQDLIDSFELCKKSDTYWTTAGVHPCRANEAASNLKEYFNNMEVLIEKYRDKSGFLYSIYLLLKISIIKPKRTIYI